MAGHIPTAPQCTLQTISPGLIETTQFFPICPIPDYLLADILLHLDTLTLLTCRSVCHFWKWTTENHTRLKLLLFTHPPSSTPQKSYALHPVFRRLDYHFQYFCNPVASIIPLEQRLDFRLNHHSPALSSVVNNYATAPAVQEIVVRICGGEKTVRRVGGVRVWDLMVGFDELYIPFPLASCISLSDNGNSIREQHSHPVNTPLQQHLAWDCIQFPYVDSFHATWCTC